MFSDLAGICMWPKSKDNIRICHIWVLQPSTVNAVIIEELSCGLPKQKNKKVDTSTNI